MFEVRNLSFSYNKRPLLKDVSFVVSPGEIVSLVGDNGAGKTTLLKVLSTLLLPSGGQVLLEGQSAFVLPINYRHQLGYLPEESALYEDMTVKKYLYYRAALKGEMTKRIRRRVGEALEMCKITSIASRRIETLSMGQKKRVALADAILLRPKVLLLDDFLAGLDVDMRESLGEILSSVAAFSSVILSGHEIENFARWSTRFIILRDGVISSTVQAVGVDYGDLVNRVRGALKGDIL